MQASARLYTVVVLILFTGIGLILYKHLVLGFPLMPDEKKFVWTIEAKIDFQAYGEPVIVSLALPPKEPRLTFMEEDFASSDYGFSELSTDEGRRGQWSKRSAQGNQTAYYRLSVYENDKIAALQPSDAPKRPKKPELDEVFLTASMTLLDQVRARSANPEIFTRELIQTLNGSGRVIKYP